MGYIILIIIAILVFGILLCAFATYVNLINTPFVEVQCAVIGFFVGFIIGWILQRNYIITASYNMSYYVVEGTPHITAFILPTLLGALSGFIFYLFSYLPFIQKLDIKRKRKKEERHRIIDKYVHNHIDEEVLNSKWYKKEIKREARQKRKEEKKDNYWNEPWP